MLNYQAEEEGNTECPHDRSLGGRRAEEGWGEGRRPSPPPSWQLHDPCGGFPGAGQATQPGSSGPEVEPSIRGRLRGAGRGH